MIASIASAGVDVKVVEVLRLDGLPAEHIPVLFSAMAGCTNGQRMAVVLYFMSELPDGRHTLADIERNLRLIFPPSVRSRLIPSQYSDFAASAVRFMFNAETRAVRLGELARPMRLWTSPSRGRWRNTDLGNSYAMNILRQRAILVRKAGVVANATEIDLPVVPRPYLEEDHAEPPIAQPDDEATTEVQPDNLLAYVDRVLEGLPDYHGGAIVPALNTTVEISGTPDDVRALIQRLVDGHAPERVTLTLTIAGGGVINATVRTEA